MSRKSKGARSRQKPRNGLYIALAILATLLVGVGAIWFLTRSGEAGSTKPEAASAGTKSPLAPASQLSAKVLSAPPVVQEAYRFAIANPETLSKFPCYCGCGQMGHMDNLECFVKDFNADGSIVFDYHALG